MTTWVFSYGTLRLPAVQQGLFGRSVDTVPDALLGWRLDHLAVRDEAVVALSGEPEHPILRPGARADRVEGARLRLRDSELPAVDRYEVNEYRRLEVELESGIRAWVYVAREESAPVPGADSATQERLRGLPSLTGTAPPFDVELAPDSPGALFETWLSDAIGHGLDEPHAMTLSTVDADGLPDARVLILKDFDQAGRWAFASSADSAKGRQLVGNRQAALTFYWSALARSIRIRGTVSADTAAASEADFSARGASARAIAVAGRQGEPLESPAAFAVEVEAARARVDVTPADWRKYWLTADEVEFWQADPSRQHTRLHYRRQSAGWTKRQLRP